MIQKKYYFVTLLYLIGFIGFSQTPDDILKDPSNTIELKFKKIERQTSNQLSQKTQTNTEQKSISLENIEKESIIKELDGPCLIDPETGECIEGSPPPDCLKINPFTGECLDGANPDCIKNLITGECIDVNTPDCLEINPLTGECIDKGNDTSETSDPTAGTTAGEFSVSLTGAATYTVPIALPPGIKDIAPAISLSYSSQASNGLAGWGWNIGGLSTITRVPSTKYHDGIIDGVDFDENDRFALDGQRLLVKTGEYGAPNSEYQTENYSNIKIKAYGTSPYGANYGPSYFKVFYPDGTVAYYGSGGYSGGKLEWALSKRIDPQDNYIQYTYSQSNGLLRINTISYGARSFYSSPNIISFFYKTRTRPELSYVGNESFKRTKILDRIEVKGGFYQLYRKYTLTHSDTSLGYQKVKSIEESNGLDQSFSAISFDYGSTSSSIDYLGSVANNLIDSSDLDDSRLISGEFNGNSILDYVSYNINNKTKINLHADITDPYSSDYIIHTGSFDEIFASNILWDGKILSQQAITTINEHGGTTKFKTFGMAPSGPGFQYDKNWELPTFYNYTCRNGYPHVETEEIPQKYVPGDFNGDGLTDVLAISKPYYQTFFNFSSGDCSESSKRIDISKVTFIDLNRNISTSFDTSSGSLQQSIKSSDILKVADFNGDGKTDLLHFTEGKLFVYELDENNTLQLIYSKIDSNIKMNLQILLGDYNGDGKTDFAIPTKDKTKIWNFFISTGSDLFVYSKDIGVYYSKTYVGSIKTLVNGWIVLNPLYIHKYFANDFNGDGKSDILHHYVLTPYKDSDVLYKFGDKPPNLGYLHYYENDNIELNDQVVFKTKISEEVGSENASKYDMPIFVEANNNSSLEYAYIHGDEIRIYNIGSDHSKDVQLNKITNNGVETEIFYDRLGNDDSRYYSYNSYSEDYSENYPFININLAPGLKLVREATKSGAGHTQRQKFSYHGAVSNAQGLGFLGFKTVGRTNWYGDGVGTIWNISKQDMANRGAVYQQWISTSSSYTPYNYIEKTDYTYSSEFLSNKVFVNVPTEITSENLLTGVISTQNFIYDSYYNPLEISTNYPGGSKTIFYEYLNDLSPTSKYYHIGRPTSKKEVSVLGSDTFSTEVQFTYNNNLVTQIKKKGNNTDWITESMEYDIFGNTTKKTLSADGVASRSEQFEYDSSGRFLTKSIDIEGLETTYTYDYAKGTPLTVTSPYGLSKSFEYDAWQRLLKEINYLGKETTYAYNYENVSGVGNCFTKSIDYPEGQDSKSYFNAFGWVIQSRIISLNDKWIQKKVEYDAIGRKLKESEPYFSTDSPTQWNQFYFDEYGRPISQLSYTGKVINTSYSGLTVTVTDDEKTVISTKDPAGNIIKMQDPGGIINYEYYANGSMKSAIYDNHTVSTTIDGWGRKIALSDPSAGNYTY